MIAIYFAIALLFACLVAGADLDPKRIKLAAMFVLLSALCWPIVLGIVLRAQVLTWRDGWVIKWRRRKLRA